MFNTDAMANVKCRSDGPSKGGEIFKSVFVLQLFAFIRIVINCIYSLCCRDELMQSCRAVLYYLEPQAN